MTTKTLITLLLLAGYVAALPALLWGLGDLRHIPGGVWRHAAQRPRAQWRAGMITAYALGGWPAFASVLAWRRSRERADLLDEWAHLSRRKRLARRRAREDAHRSDAGSPEHEPEHEHEIVLRDHEDEPASTPLPTPEHEGA